MTTMTMGSPGYQQLARDAGVTIDVLAAARIAPGTALHRAIARLRAAVGTEAWEAAQGAPNRLRAGAILRAALAAKKAKKALPAKKARKPIETPHDAKAPEDEEPDEDEDEDEGDDEEDLPEPNPDDEPEPEPTIEEIEEEDRQRRAAKKRAKKKAAPSSRQAVIDRLVAKGWSRQRAAAAYDASGFADSRGAQRHQPQRPVGHGIPESIMRQARQAPAVVNAAKRSRASREALAVNYARQFLLPRKAS